MNLRTVRAFVEVVRRGGFSQAAEVVLLTQSAISKAVRTLEEELGVPLLNRVGHRCELTTAGEVVYRRALVMLAERDDLISELKELQGLQRGTLRIGLPPVGSGVLFSKMFTAYRRRYPNIEIQLLEHGGEQLHKSLQGGVVDLAAILAPLDPELDGQDVRVESLTVVLSANHPLADRPELDFPTLAAEPFILFEEGFTLNRIILDACERKAVAPKISARSAQIDFIVDLVEAELGVAFLPHMLAEKYQNRAIRLVPLTEPQTDWHMMLAWRRQAHLPAAARAWLELAREMLP
ncbi:MAG: LysR family transcriptional regulator [Burkholderiales bacterium]|nr:LysR family transcriptional regulator [Burkholderiales bacterium]